MHVSEVELCPPATSLLLIACARQPARRHGKLRNAQIAPAAVSMLSKSPCSDCKAGDLALQAQTVSNHSSSTSSRAPSSGDRSSGGSTPAGGAGGTTVTTTEGRSWALIMVYLVQISKLLAKGHDQYVPGTDMGTAVTQLLLHAPMPAAAEATMQHADGTWEVRVTSRRCSASFRLVCWQKGQCD